MPGQFGAGQPRRHRNDAQANEFGERHAERTQYGGNLWPQNGSHSIEQVTERSTFEVAHVNDIDIHAVKNRNRMPDARPGKSRANHTLPSRQICLIVVTRQTRLLNQEGSL